LSATYGTTVMMRRTSSTNVSRLRGSGSNTKPRRARKRVSAGESPRRARKNGPSAPMVTPKTSIRPPTFHPHASAPAAESGVTGSRKIAQTTYIAKKSGIAHHSRDTERRKSTNSIAIGYCCRFPANHAIATIGSAIATSGTSARHLSLTSA